MESLFVLAGSAARVVLISLLQFLAVDWRVFCLSSGVTSYPALLTI